MIYPPPRRRPTRHANAAVTAFVLIGEAVVLGAALAVVYIVLMVLA